MIEIKNDYIPTLNERLSINAFDKKSFLICIDDEIQTKFIIPPITKILLDQVDGKKSITEITASFNTDTGAEFNTEMIVKIFNDTLIGYGVLKDDGIEKVKVKDNYLKLRFILFPEKVVSRIVQPILFLFNKKLFFTLFSVTLAVLSGIFILHINFKELYAGLTPAFAGWFVVFNIASIIFHEFGHAGACTRFGARNGAIGFGFYLITPVFYADVSDAWRLKRHERLIVDLAGIYMQVICCMALAVAFYSTNNLFYLHIAFLIFSTILVNINPFLRFDGYWALCDLINVPNLRENSLRQMKQFFRKVVGKPNKWNASGINSFLVVYAVASISFIFYFLALMLVFQNNSIIYFPVNIYFFFSYLFTQFNTIDFQWLKLHLTAFILPFIFYLSLFRLLKSNVLIFLKKR